MGQFGSDFPRRKLICYGAECIAPVSALEGADVASVVNE